MSGKSSLSNEYFDKETNEPAGYRDKRGEWRPASPARFAPIFDRPGRISELFGWVINYLFSWNLLYIGITMATWLYFQPPLEACSTFKFGWIAQMFFRNMVLLWIVYGGWHFYLYSLKKRGYKGKYTPRWQSTDGATFLFRNQIYDNVFWSCTSGCITWTAYEVVTMWLYANNHLPYIDPKASPIAFAAVLVLIPIWREFHFYWIHRLIHWKPLYDRIHYLHHYNINVGPWSGLAMHPVEHILYFSVTLIHWIIPSHPIHFLFNAQHTALTPAPSHTGFEGKLGGPLSFGSYFHYLHHRHFNCNYGESTIPLDRWFGSYDDGSLTDSERSDEKRHYYEYIVERIVDESFEVKSFYLRRSDDSPLDLYQPGQHLMFKIPTANDGVVLRFYTLSDIAGSNLYRISVKREHPPTDNTELPSGEASTYLHDSIKVGDHLEARGPLGDFTPDRHSGKPMTLISGGIGITPILAILKNTLREHPRQRVHLFLAFRSTKHQLFKDELDALLKKYRKVVCHTFFDEMSEEEVADMPNTYARRLDMEFLKSTLPDFHQNFYICGARPMMEDLVEGLKACGVEDDHIHTEAFTHSHQEETTPIDSEQHEIYFTKSDKTLIWDAEYKNLLEFAESNGVTMEAGCMFGGCGACAVEIEEGEVEYNYDTAHKPKDGFCLACSCRPKSALRIVS